VSAGRRAAAAALREPAVAMARLETLRQTVEHGLSNVRPSAA
jgi:hypothetical protein